MVLGMDFMEKVKAAFTIPYTSTMCIVDEGSSSTVSVVRAKVESNMLSAMQISKSCNV